MLIGEYTHTIDEKKRIALPVKFRKALGKTIVLAPGLDTCLFIFTMNEWERFSKQLAEVSFLQKDHRSFNRYMSGQAIAVDIDKSGRILIPDHLKVKARLDKNAVFVGVQNRVELWDERTWNDYKLVIEKEADSLAEKLSQVGIL